MDSTQRDIGVLTDAPVRFPFQCSAWRSGNSYLLQDSEVGKNYPESIFGKSLTWFTTERGVSPRPCRVFEGERIHGYAIAVDGSLIAVITSLREDSQHRTFLNVLDGQSCREVKRFELDFPEKPEQRSAFLSWVLSRRSPDPNLEITDYWRTPWHLGGDSADSNTPF